MKISCTTLVHTRTQLQNIGLKLNNKYLKSTLALCRNGNKEDFMLILFTGQNKTGCKYKVSNNVQTILTKFIEEGKATIQLKEPAVDIYIKGESITLKSFLHLLRRALQKKISEKELTVSSLSVTPLADKQIAPVKLIVRKRSELPIRGFPRTLKTLVINDIDLAKLPIGVLQLQALQVLDISCNSVECLPVELKNLALQQLNVSENQLHKSGARQWEWVGGTLAKTLYNLDLSRNKLGYVPANLRKLQNLRELRLNNNKLKLLPRWMGCFRRLNVLDLGMNMLTELPGSMHILRMEQLDISGNSFRPPCVQNHWKTGKLGVPTLLEVAARVITNLKIPYSVETTPRTLVDYLDNVTYCVCGKAVFEQFYKHMGLLFVKQIARTVIATGDDTFIVTDCYFCSVRCMRRLLARGH